jgi:hypothetical protein
MVFHGIYRRSCFGGPAFANEIPDVNSLKNLAQRKIA